MGTREYLKLYNENKYWNLDVREEFLNETRNMWRNYTDKENGHIFSSARAAATEEDAAMVR
jgi:hypothetical protein